MVLSLRNRDMHHTTNDGNLKVEKLPRQENVQLVKDYEDVPVKKKHKRTIQTEKLPKNNETSHIRKSPRGKILADKTNKSDAVSQVNDFNKSKTVNSSPKSISITKQVARERSNAGSKKNKSPRNQTNKELDFKKQNCIYSHEADSRNENLKPEKYAVYEFETDENDPAETNKKGLKRKRKLRIHKKLGCTVEEEIQAKNKILRLKKFKTQRHNKGKTDKLPDPKSKGETFRKPIIIEAKKTNGIVSEESSHHLEERVADQKLSTPLEHEHRKSVSESSTGLLVCSREMSPEIFNISKFGFTTSTAERCSNINRCAVNNVSGKLGKIQQSKDVLQNNLQVPSGEKNIHSVEFLSPILDSKQKSKVPRALLSLFSPVPEARYDDISVETDMPSPICEPNLKESSKNLQHFDACTSKSMPESTVHNISVESTTSIHTPASNSQKANSSNHGTQVSSSCKKTEDFNIGNCFGFDDDEEIILPRVVKRKMNGVPLNQGRHVEELPHPFRANIIIPRRPLYPRINYKCSSNLDDQKQDSQECVASDPNVTIFDLEDVECAADPVGADAASLHAEILEKDDPLESSLSQESPKCYPVPKRLRPVRMKPIIEGSENEEDEGEEEATVKRHKKSHKTKAHDKELNKWATSFNSMCDEVDSFELCVE